MRQSSCRIQAAVITSSTERPLKDFIWEVRQSAPAALFDLMVFRATDIAQLCRWVSSTTRSPLEQQSEIETSLHDSISPASSLLMQSAKNVPVIVDWIEEQLPESARAQPVFSALATFFPDVTHRVSVDALRLYDRSPRDIAINAVANSVSMAIMLAQRGMLRTPVVEIVCGTVLDQCRCRMCESELHSGGEVHVVESSLDVKWSILLDSLRRVKDIVQDTHGRSEPWALALEVEPGSIFVLSRAWHVDAFFQRLEGCGDSEVQRYVGLNLDIAHMCIAGDSADSLRRHAHRIVHGHICDHPGMHTRDQPVGSWLPVERRGTPRHEYITLLSDAYSCERADGVPVFTGALALELEGCNRIKWVHDGLSAIERAVKMI